jgi:hypothetical protein
MLRHCIVLIGLSLLLVVPSFGQAKPDSEKMADIQKLIAITGGEKVQQAMTDQLVSSLSGIFIKAAGNDERAERILRRFSEILSEEFKKTSFSEIAVGLYDKYFTDDEVKGLIAFYETPIGQKSIQVLPALVQESTTLGMEKGRLAGSNAMSRLIVEFPELKGLKAPQ